MLKLISVGLVYDNIYKKFLLVKHLDERDWALPATNVKADEHPAFTLTNFIRNSTSVVSQPQMPDLGRTRPELVDSDEWPRVYWLCIAHFGKPVVIPGQGVTRAEYVDRSEMQNRLAGRMPTSFNTLLRNIA